MSSRQPGLGPAAPRTLWVLRGQVVLVHAPGVGNDDETEIGDVGLDGGDVQQGGDPDAAEGRIRFCLVDVGGLLVTTKDTDPRMMQMERICSQDNDSPKAIRPIKSAVTGSIAPKMAVFDGPGRPCLSSMCE